MAGMSPPFLVEVGVNQASEPQQTPPTPDPTPIPPSLLSIVSCSLVLMVRL